MVLEGVKLICIVDTNLFFWAAMIYGGSGVIIFLFLSQPTKMYMTSKCVYCKWISLSTA